LTRPIEAGNHHKGSGDQVRYQASELFVPADQITRARGPDNREHHQKQVERRENRERQQQESTRQQFPHEHGRQDERRRYRFALTVTPGNSQGCCQHVELGEGRENDGYPGRVRPSLPAKDEQPSRQHRDGRQAGHHEIDSPAVRPI